MAAAVILLLSGPAVAQDDEEDSPPPTTGEVGDVVIEQPAPAVAPAEQVRGAVQTQPLPRTGGDFGPEVLAGLALTGAGIALAAGARRRRSRAATA